MRMTTETSNARGEWVLVPRVPTPEMWAAWHSAPDNTDDAIACNDAYAAMLAAAPPPAAARGDVRGLVAKWEADAATARDDANYSRAGGIEDCADELKAALSGEGTHRAQNTGLLDAIEQYAAAVEQDVRSKLRFTSYAARESAKQTRKKKKEAMRSALAAEGVQAGEATSVTALLNEAIKALMGLNRNAQILAKKLHSRIPTIASALSQQPEARGVVDVEAIRSLAADMMAVVSEVDDIGALGSHVVAFANRLNALTGERNG